MKQFAFLTAAVLCTLICRADHVTGGEMYYTFGGISNGEYKYTITMKYFMRCNSGRQFYNPAAISIFNKTTHALIQTVDVPLATQQTLSLTSPNPCITNPPTVCYEVGYYNFDISLPGTIDGYKIASQVTYRIQGINNLSNGYAQVGATYTAEIPGTKDVSNGPSNNSAVFTGTDLVIVCADNSFTYSFAAIDNDGDELRYSFCEAFTHSNSSVTPTGGNPPGNPPYSPVPYGTPFNGSSPLGGKVNIDSKTGLITGTAPSAGAYVVTVCVEELRNGKVIATQRKDIQINIAPCTIAGAVLPPEYMLCKATKTIQLSNLSMSPLVKTQTWSILDRSGAVLTSSSNPSVAYTFADTGLYRIKLIVNAGQICSDSTTSLARVYPGFVPSFSYDGKCFNKPTAFIDASTSVYGSVNYWNWDFGEQSVTTDVSNQKNPTYTYPSMGVKFAQLIVGNSVGCRDTLGDYPNIVDKPPLRLAFWDTLICVNDQVQLKAGAPGNYSWSPGPNIINGNTATPTVSPRSTTTFYANLDDNGCLNRDSVRVRVTDRVDLTAMADTVICAGDTIQLRVASNGFKYSWTPASQLSSASVQNPVAITQTTTSYIINASIGGCVASETVVVRTVPYPAVNAGADTLICDQASVQLNATIAGNTFSWSPAATLSNSNQLNPVAFPKATTTYNLLVFDNKGCPKPGFDQVTVTVLPPIKASAGNDTLILSGQPLQLLATGGIKYTWTPSTGLSNVNVANPVATFNNSVDSVRYKVQVFNQAGCSESAFISVRVFKSPPTVFVPNAFTPDRDGKNDLLKPIAVGMKQIEYFNIYNRWGQLVFSTVANQNGWDGTLRGKPQNSGMYVWAVKAIDYTGKRYMQKGTAVLLR